MSDLAHFRTGCASNLRYKENSDLGMFDTSVVLDQMVRADVSLLGMEFVFLVTDMSSSA